MRALAIVGLLAAACSTDVAPSNPFDPGAPPSQQQEGTVKGTLDSSSGPLPSSGQTLRLSDEEGVPLAATTGDAGSFAFAVKPGRYDLYVELAGYVPFVRPNIKVAPGAVVDLGSVKPFNAGQGPLAAQLSGTVQLADGRMPLGAYVQATRNGASAADATVPVDNLGRFGMTLAPTAYKVRAFHFDYVEVLADVTLAAGQVLDLGASLVLQINPATITGTVLREDLDAASGGLVAAEGATVLAGTGSVTAVSADGSFILGGLAGGAHSVTLQLAGHHDPSGPRQVVVAGGGTASLGTLVLRRDTGRIAGVVALSDGRDPRGASASLLGSGRSTAVGPDGTFQLDGVPTGSYALVVARDRYGQATVQPVAVSRDAVTRVPTITLTPLAGDYAVFNQFGRSDGYANTTTVWLELKFAGAARYRASEDASFTGVDFQTYDPQDLQPFDLAALEGTHTISAQYEDAQSSRSPIFEADVVLDTAPPSGPSIAIDGGRAFTRLAAPSLTLLAAELQPVGVDRVSGLDKVYLSYDGATDAAGQLVGAAELGYLRDTVQPLGTTPLADGPHTIYAQFSDHAGNLSEIVSATAILDRVEPQNVSLSIARGAQARMDGYTNNPLVALALDADSEPWPGAGLEVKLSNRSGLAGVSYQPFENDIGWLLGTPSADGRKDVYARIRDAAGNEILTDLNDFITLDQTSPAPVSISVPAAQNGFVRRADVTVSLSAQDDEGLAPQPVAVSQSPTFSGATFAALTGTAQLDLSPAPGPKTIYARFVDRAGNFADTSVSVDLDNDPPTASLVIGDGSGFSGASLVALTLTGASPDLDMVRVTQDPSGAVDCGSDSGYVIYAPSLSTTFASDGPHRVAVCLMDAAGNVSSAALAGDIVVDTLPPEGSGLIVQANAAGRVRSRFVTLSLEAVSDEQSGVAEMQVLVDSASFGAVYKPFAPIVPLALPAVEGFHSVNVQVRDYAGKVRTLPAIGVTLDTLAPTGTVTIIAAGQANRAATNATSVTLQYTVAADTSGYKVSSSPLDCTALGDADFGPLPAGPQEAKSIGPDERIYTFYVCFVDGAGNRAGSSASVLYDKTPPSGTLLLGDGALYQIETSVNLRVTASSESTMVVSRDASTDCATATYAALPSEQTVTFTGEGAHAVYVCLRDVAGNVTVSPLSASAIVDLNPPSGGGVVLEAVNQRVQSRFVTLSLESVSDSVSGLADMEVLVDSSTFAGRWQNFASRLALALPAVEGPHNVNVKVRDRAGRPATLPQISVTLDSLAPAGGVTLLADGMTDPVATRVTTVALRYTVADATGYKVSSTPVDCASLAGGDFAALPGGAPPSENKTIGPAEGAYSFYVCYVDAAGNRSATQTGVLLDQTPPSGSALLGSGAAYQQSLALSLDVSPSEAMSGMVVSKDAAPNCAAASYSSYLPTQTVTFTIQGAHFVDVCLRDLARNVTATPIRVPVTVDTQAPSGQGAIKEATGGKVRVQLVTLSLEGVTDPVSGMDEMEVRVDGSVFTGAWRAFAPLTTIDLGAEGLHNVYARVKDRAGLEYTLNAIQVTLDRVPPVVSVKLVAGGVENPLATDDTDVSLQYTTGDAVGYKVSASALDCANLAAAQFGSVIGSEPKTIGPAEGVYTFHVCFRDDADNRASAQVSTVLDRTPPFGTAVLGNGAEYQVTGSLNLSVTASELIALMAVVQDAASVNCASQGGYQTFMPNQTLTFTGQGAHSVHVCLEDRAGNRTPQAIALRTIVDTLAPVCSITLSSLSGYTATNGTTVIARLSVADASPLRMALANDPLPASPTLAPFVEASLFELAPGADGPRTVDARVVDAAGHICDDDATILLDRVAPSGTISVAGGAAYVNRALAGSNTDTFPLTFTSSDASKMQYRVAPTLHPCPRAESITDPLVGNASVDIPGSVLPIPNDTASNSDDGLYVASACFVDSAGNVTQVADSVEVDRVLPTGSVQLLDARTEDFVNIPVVRVNVGHSQPAGGMMALTCDGTAPTNFVPYTGATSCVIPGPDCASKSCKTLRLVVRDAAGNQFTASTATATLDTTPPTAPVITTTPGFKGKSFGTARATHTLVSLDTSGAVTETNFDRYQRLSDLETNWTTAAADPIDTTSYTSLAANRFMFRHRAMTSDVAGAPDSLKLRAVDLAGNVSAVSVVSFHLDMSPPPPPAFATGIVPPPGPTWRAATVRNFDGKGVVVFDLSRKPPDVTATVIDYGPISATVVAPGACSGARGGDFSAEGPSPIRTLPDSGTLSGLPNGVPVHAVACWVDQAGNVGPSTDEFVLQPNEVPISLIQTNSVSTGESRRMVANGAWLYLLGMAGSVPILQVLDAAKLVSPLQASKGAATVRGPVPGTSLPFADLYDSGYRNLDMALDGQYLFLAGGSRVKILSLANPADPQVVTTVNLASTAYGGSIDYSAYTGNYGAWGTGCGAAAVLRIQSIAVRGTTLVASGTENFVVALDLSTLWDRNPATLPGPGNLIGISCPPNALGQTYATVPHAARFTRNRLHLLHLTTDSIGFNMADALDFDSLTTWNSYDWMALSDMSRGWLFVPGNPVYFGQALGAGELQAQSAISGNYLYASMHGFQVFQLNNLWANSPGTVTPTDLVFSLGVRPSGQLQVVGSQVFATDRGLRGVRAFDLTDARAPRESALYRGSADTSRHATLQSGNYLFTGRGDGVVETYELAAPTQLRVVASSTGAGDRGEVDGGFFYASNGAVFDLQSRWPPRVENSLPYGQDCAMDGARFEEAMVSALGNRLGLVDLDKVTDRNPSTTFSMSSTSDYVTLAMPALRRVTAVEAWGNYLVAAEIRGDGDSGTYLEVFDARKLRDRQPRSPHRLSGFTLADSIGAVKVSNFASSTGWADLHLASGRAVVTLSESSYFPNGAPPTNGLVIADIRSLLDDDSSTLPGAQVVQGTLDLRNAREAVVRGNLAVVATDAGVVLANISQAMDENPATNALAIDRTIALPGAESVALSGSWLVAYAKGGGAAGLRAYDLTPYFEAPATGTPRLESFYATANPTGYGGYLCGALDRYEVARSKLTLAGSRAYAVVILSPNETPGGVPPSLVIFDLQ